MATLASLPIRAYHSLGDEFVHHCAFNARPARWSVRGRVFSVRSLRLAHQTSTEWLRAARFQPFGGQVVRSSQASTGSGPRQGLMGLWPDE